MNHTRNYLILISLIFSTVLLSSCATKPRLPRDLTIHDYKKPGYALIVGSVSRLKGLRNFSDAALLYAALDTYPPIEGTVSSKHYAFKNYDFNNVKFAGDTFAAIVPAGRIEFFSFRLRNFNAVSYPAEQFSVEFNAIENRINYIGEYTISDVRPDSFLAGQSEYGYWGITDAWYRDKHLLATRYPNLAWDNVVTSLPQQSNSSIVIITDAQNEEDFHLPINASAQLIEKYTLQISSENYSAIRTVAREVISRNLQYNEKIQLAAANKIQAHYLKEHMPDFQSDALAWLCNILGEGKNPKYKPLLTDVRENATHSKLQKHAKKTLEEYRSREEIDYARTNRKGALFD